MSVASRPVVRVLLFPAIALFVVLFLLTLASPSAAADDLAPSQAGTNPPSLNGHGSHCRQEGASDDLPTGGTAPAATPTSTHAPVPAESHRFPCWLMLLAGLLGVPAAIGVLGLGRRHF